MAYGPLAHGLLTGTFTRETTFGAQDWRASGKAFGLPIFERDNLIKNVAVADGLRHSPRSAATPSPTGPRLGPAESAVSVALVGARKADEIATALPAASWHLSDDDVAAIERLMGRCRRNE
jgi:aryl-alcohol dehydrogenase-like predicted oxidoreductase